MATKKKPRKSAKKKTARKGVAGGIFKQASRNPAYKRAKAAAAKAVKKASLAYKVAIKKARKK